MQCLPYSLWKPKQVFPLAVSRRGREGGREDVIFPNGYLDSYLYCQLSCWVFSLVVYLKKKKSIWHQQKEDRSIARSPHRKKLLTSSIILKKICFLKINFLMIFWTGDAMLQHRNESGLQEAYIFDMPPIQDFPVLCQAAIGSAFLTCWWLCCGHCLSCGLLGTTFAFC